MVGMSFMMSGPNATRENGLPRGELVSTHTTREAAQDQLQRLVDGDVPPTAVTIVGKDLRVVERVRGRMSYPQAALSAGLRGLLFGTLIGLFMYLLSPQGGWQQIVFSALLGVGLWMILGVIAYGMRKDRNGFASTQQVVPAAYDVVVAFEHAGRARGILNAGTGQAVPVAQGPSQPGPHGVPTTAPSSAPQGTGAPSPAPDGAASAGPQGGPASAAQDRPGQGVQSGATGEDGQVPPQGQGTGAHAAEGPQTRDGQAARPADGSAAEGAPADGAPQGLDRAYGLRLSQEEVDRIIAARGGTPGQSQPPEPPQGGSGR